MNGLIGTMIKLDCYQMTFFMLESLYDDLATNPMSKL